MRLSFYLDKTAERPFFSIKIADPVALRRRLIFVSMPLMSVFVVSGLINMLIENTVPLRVNLPFGLVAGVLWYFIALIDEESRREKAEAEYERQVVEALPHEQ